MPILWLTMLLALPVFAAPQRFEMVSNLSPSVTFVVDAPLDSITGVSHAVTGELQTDLSSWTDTRAWVSVDLSRFATGISLRDEDLRDQFFQVDQYPAAVLTVSGLERISNPVLAPEMDAQADAIASFSLHGVTKALRIPVTVRRRDAAGRIQVTVQGSFTAVFADYAIPRPSRLFLKLGDRAKVTFRATFMRNAEPDALASASQGPPKAPAVNAPQPKAPVHEAERPVVARKPVRARTKVAALGYLYSLTRPEGRGERLFTDATVGGPRNVLACASCHALSDERFGILTATGTVKPATSLWNSAQRPGYWQGFAATVDKATDICVKRFMLKPEGGTPGQLTDLAAYLKKLSPDVQPPLDYAALLYTRHTGIDRATAGDAPQGQKLATRYCEPCHANGSVRPPLTQGLYEEDYLVRRVREIPGHDNQQMPPLSVARLSDSELRDIVTYLVGDPSQRIFKRKKAPRPPAVAPPPASAGPAVTGSR